MKIVDVVWNGVAGLCGGIVWLILKQHISARLALVVCVISTMFGIFVGDMVASYFGLSKAGTGFLCGVASIKFCVMVADGTILDLFRGRWKVEIHKEEK